MMKIFPRFVPLYPVLGLLGACAQAVNVVSVCNSSIYCQGELLKTVQLARIFPDSKTFVDMKLKTNENDILVHFKKLMDETDNHPTRPQLVNFVKQHFEGEDALYNWNPPDFNPTPPVLDEIEDPNLKKFAKDIISIWPTLGRKVTKEVCENPDQYSLICMPNGFIVPGGRFNEIYYWDSYWIVKGLLISDMMQTARGVIENLLHLVEKFGYVPNGSRIYYLGRSQPPLLTRMVSDYVSTSGDISWLERNIKTIEKELQYWLEKKKVDVEVNGTKYTLLRYVSDERDLGPRPESYYEDYFSSQLIPEAKREQFYVEMKTAAESGWDFSSRWFMPVGNNTKFNLTDLHTSYVLPVDLNSMFAEALQLAGDFRNKLKDNRGAYKWWSLAKYWRHAIDEVMWDGNDGAWYDYDMKDEKPRREFFPSCAAPLWAGAVEPDRIPKYAEAFVKYLQATSALDFPGGIPSSLLHTGEQWDFPNAWPPLQSIIIGGLERSGDKEGKLLAKELVEIWIRANYIGFKKWKMMFEKYSCVEPGSHGGGGEYVVQNGFGWTNGIVLELLQKYGKVLMILEAESENVMPSVRIVK